MVRNNREVKPGLPLRTFAPGCQTLEIGIGSHLLYEDYKRQNYHAIELRIKLCQKIRDRFPTVNAITGDCQERLPFEDRSFNRVLAIHVLEHLPNLPACLNELWPVLSDNGRLSVVIPTEGGWGTSIARNLSGRRKFKKTFHQDYDWLIKSEHSNITNEILNELASLFEIAHRRFSPLLFPSINLNLAIGLTLCKKYKLLDLFLWLCPPKNYAARIR
jgi:ubiquinone/menaquinone biosynthesis C-methylase UbiE